MAVEAADGFTTTKGAAKTNGERPVTGELVVVEATAFPLELGAIDDGNFA